MEQIVAVVGWSFIMSAALGVLAVFAPRRRAAIQKVPPAADYRGGAAGAGRMHRPEQEV